MTKVQIKSEKNTHFGEIFQVRELFPVFPRYVGSVIDKKCILSPHQQDQ